MSAKVTECARATRRESISSSVMLYVTVSFGDFFWYDAQPIVFGPHQISRNPRI